MQSLDLTSNAWPDYELLDSGHNRKLERYGQFTLIRPETQAIWNPSRPELWGKADAEFKFAGEKGGKWLGKKLPEEYVLAWQSARFSLRLTSFKHTGVFPEQAANWEWLSAKLKVLSERSESNGQHLKHLQQLEQLKHPQVLNLFGYTGIASIVAGQSGARVTHVDASRQSNTWAKENAKLSGISEGVIRYILEDALKFAEREVRRGSFYDGIILDPPAFGRGPEGEIWRIEEHLPKLLSALEKVMSPNPGSFFLLNGYAAGYSPTSFLQAVQSIFSEKNLEYGELSIQESASSRLLPSGIYVRFIR